MRRTVFMAIMMLSVLFAEASYRYEVFPLFQAIELEQYNINGTTLYLSGHDILSSLAESVGLYGQVSQLLSIKVQNVDFDVISGSYIMHYDLLNNEGIVVSASSRILEKGSDGWLYLVGGK